ncbi:uncharacterized protein MYU51_002661 [Penicillium brevicompactum]
MRVQTQTDAMELDERVDSGAHHNAVESLQEPAPRTKWVYLKIFSAGISFFVAGVNDGSLGSIIPYILQTYAISTNMVSILYAATFAGWFIAALSNNTITRYLDLGPTLCTGAGLQILAHALRAWNPPFALYVVTFFLASLGQAYNDTFANTFVSTLNDAHRCLGFIHAMYMAGCLVAPFIATGIASANTDSDWCLFYLCPLGLGVVNLALVGSSFHDHMATPASLRSERRERPESKSILREMKDVFFATEVWLLSLFFFFFLGATITAGGWMVEYLVEVRNGDVAKMGYIPAGFSGGALLGRILLSEPTHRLGDRLMIFIYALLCIGLQLVFWLVPSIIPAAVAISFLGFFSGPFFASGVSLGTRLFPTEIRSSAIALVFVLGQIGGSAFPALTGIIAGKVRFRMNGAHDYESPKTELSLSGAEMGNTSLLPPVYQMLYTDNNTTIKLNPEHGK